MTRAFVGMLGIGLGLGLSACFFEPAPASSFRFQCASDADCADGEVCASELCQQPCGAADSEPCPQESPICFNGFCSSVCQADDDVCPAPQECIALAVPGEEEPTTGICGVLCADESSCPDGDVCIMGACATPCIDDSECDLGEVCTTGFCIPG